MFDLAEEASIPDGGAGRDILRSPPLPVMTQSINSSHTGWQKHSYRLQK